jgi:asparagine synthase (glutamine-hydrolysing)
MCGFTGFWTFQPTYQPAEAKAILLAMSQTIAHRGPNSQGTWYHPKKGLGFAHQRLSIVDLSEHGHQPMVCPYSKNSLIYNGEVYNAHTLRQTLEQDHKIPFKGHSDTEVILAACGVWGVEKTLEKLNGMFALAFWSESEQTLCLARDRLGIKPLYWGMVSGTLLFGSQLKSFHQHPQWRGTINPKALHHYFQLSYVPAPLSIYQDIHKLAPGHMITLKSPEQITSKRYWCPHKITEQPLLDGLSEQAQIRKLDDLLSDAVKARMVADVPLGAFLSGGIDSSTVVALMQKHSPRPIKTFSIGFDDPKYNEANHAKIIAQHLGTDHHESILTANDAMATIPDMPQWYDEPFADSSQIPTFLVSKMAKQHVAVSLSGDGGDELFAGYSRYHIGYKLWSRLGKVPLWGRKGLAHFIQAFPPGMWDHLRKCYPFGGIPKQVGHQINKLASILPCDNIEDYYKHLVSCWQQPNQILRSPQSEYSWPSPPNHLSSIATMQWLDTMTYLPDDILTKVDRASMAVGLEARVPLLDHRVVELAWQLPFSSKHQQGQAKWLLCQVLKQYVPEPMFNRPKMGFGVPIADWLRGPLKAWGHELLSDDHLKDNPFINKEIAQKMWQQHQKGRVNHHHQLWTLLMFLAWHRHYHPQYA